MRSSPSTGTPRHVRLLAIAAAAAVALAALQRTALAPLPHRLDSFLLGLASGAVLVAIVARATVPRAPAAPTSPPAGPPPRPDASR